MSATTIWPTEFNRDDIREAYEVMKNGPLTEKSLQEIGAVVRNDTENLVKLSKILDRVKPPEIVELHSNSLKINSFLIVTNLLINTEIRGIVTKILINTVDCRIVRQI